MARKKQTDKQDIDHESVKGTVEARKEEATQKPRNLYESVTEADVYAIQKRVEMNSLLVEEISSKLVDRYCTQLHNYVSYIDNIVADRDRPPTDKQLEDFLLNLPVLLYYAQEGLETLGIKSDTANAIKMEKYNEVVNHTVGTIKDKEAMAELTVQSETIVHIAYTRAYKKIKNRIEMAMETMNSVKKIITKRTAEMDMNRISGNRNR